MKSKQHIIYYKDDELTGNHGTIPVDVSDIPEEDIVYQDFNLYADHIRTTDDLIMIKTILKIWKTPLSSSTVIPEMINEPDIISKYISDKS